LLFSTTDAPLVPAEIGEGSLNHPPQLSQLGGPDILAIAA